MLFPLAAPLNLPAQSLTEDWRATLTTAEEGWAAGYWRADFDDSAWETVRTPKLRSATLTHDTLWYRRHLALAPLPAGQRWIVRVGGAFYFTRLWFNGVELGAHEGYFQPFGADVTELVRDGDNLLVAQCRFPVEAEAFKRKTAIAGVFADWDCRPYPSALYPHLPPPTEWAVPVGLWQPVTLLTSGSVIIETLTVFPTVHQPTWPTPQTIARAALAEARLVVRVRSLVGQPQTILIHAQLEPDEFDEPSPVGVSLTLTLAAHEVRSVELKLPLERPRLWFPWTHGPAWLYRACVTAHSETGAVLCAARQRFGVREITAQASRSGWEWRLNGRRIFPKGSNYFSDFYLDRVTVDSLRRDVELARQAHLDLLRVHAHIAPPEFYDLCDSLGVMVMCDFPLIWTYAYNMPEAEAQAFRASVLVQAQAMVEGLGSHPSLVLWSMHNEPPWTPDGSFLGGDLHAQATNRAVDEAAAEQVRQFDPTRTVLAASGEHDQHLYHGWYTGSWADNRHLRPGFPSEFGVQALPNLDSPVWANLNTTWPVEAEDATWAHAGYQNLFWASPGVGLPTHYASLADYVRESQMYQAFFTRYVIDQWRRQKFNPVGGYIHFLFTDGWPAITWSVLDYYRQPKLAYTALAEASRPTHVCLDIEDGYVIEHGFHLVYPERGVVGVKVYVVNDDYQRQGDARLTWWLEHDLPPGWRGWGRRLGLWWRSGSTRLPLPTADEPARLARTLRLPMPAAGEYVLQVALWQGARQLDRAALPFRVGEKQVRLPTPRRAPRLLVNKVYQAGSLRHTEEGFTFMLYNPAMPVRLERLTAMQVDGQVIDPAQLEVVHGGLTRQVSTIHPEMPLEVPTHALLAILVRHHALWPGSHTIELTVHLAGLGEVSAQLTDKLL